MGPEQQLFANMMDKCACLEIKWIAAEVLSQDLYPQIRYQSIRCRANSAHTRQSRPDYGLGFQVKVLNIFLVKVIRKQRVHAHGVSSPAAVERIWHI